jgi:hypothetical protein
MIGDLLICIFKMAAQREFGFFLLKLAGYTNVLKIELKCPENVMKST